MALIRRIVAWHNLLTSDLFIALVNLHKLSPVLCTGLTQRHLLGVCDTPVGLWEPGVLEAVLGSVPGPPCPGPLHSFLETQAIIR